MSDTQFVVECSDDDNYDNNESNYRLVNGKKVWEPSGDQIASLYRQLEAKGFIELRWQCPGRRSPSVHNISVSAQHKSTTESNDADNGHNRHQNDMKNQILNEFDFDNEFGSEGQPQTQQTSHGIGSIGAKAVTARKRLTSGVKRSQANLSKVMMDIKKYQFVDQTRRLSIQTTGPSQTTLSEPTVSTSHLTPTSLTSLTSMTSQPSMTCDIVIKSEPTFITTEAKTDTKT